MSLSYWKIGSENPSLEISLRLEKKKEEKENKNGCREYISAHGEGNFMNVAKLLQSRTVSVF